MAKLSNSDELAKQVKAARAILGGGGGETIAEDIPSYAPKSPYNTVLVESESGHLVEIDDTHEAERIHIYHTAGSHVEMCPDGSVKYKTVKKRQDVTIGDHEILISGDWNIIVDGGYKLRVKDGDLTIHAESSAALNVKGNLKISANNIDIDASDKISLNAPKVNVGSNNGLPLMKIGDPLELVVNEKFPFDPTFVPRVRIPLSPGGKTKMNALAKNSTSAPAFKGSITSAIAQISSAQRKIQKVSSNPLTMRVDQIDESPLELVEQSLNALNTRLSALTVATAGGFGTLASLITKPKLPSSKKIAEILNEEATDAAGEPLQSKLKEQPVELPLSHSPLYQSSSTLGATGVEISKIDQVKQRGRQFESPEDISGESYDAHINLSVELGDFDANAKKSSGAILRSDTATPVPEPAPATSFDLPSGGVVQATKGSTNIIGTKTKFIEDLDNGQMIVLGGVTGIIATVISDTQLILTEPWKGSTASGVLQVYRLRPMQEFFGEFTYGDMAPLGQSGLQLRDLMVGFISPIIEVPQINSALFEGAVGDEGTDTDGGIDGSECGTPANVPALDIAQFLTADMDLSTAEGCGKFVEAVVAGTGPEIGHITKSGAQTQWNGHAVDAIFYRSSSPLYNGGHYQAIDIIRGAEAPGAAPQWMPVCAPSGAFEVLPSNWGGKMSGSGGGSSQSGGGGGPSQSGAPNESELF